MRFRESRSRPLARLTIGTHGRMHGAASRSTSRKPCDGVAITTTSAAPTASSMDEVASSCGGRVKPGRYDGLTFSSLICLASSGRRAHRVVVVF